MKPAEGAVLVDNSHCTLDETVEIMYRAVCATEAPRFPG
jgi:hypothetical protein